MVTYHPSYILRNPTNKSKRLIWEDLLQVMARSRTADLRTGRRVFFVDGPNRTIENEPNFDFAKTAHERAILPSAGGRPALRGPEPARRRQSFRF